MSEDLRPTVFVVMPFGDKRDPVSGVRIDFDAVYETALRPAAEAAGLEAVRADEEVLGGFVHLAMFERLLLAEVVLADLTLASANVMYELGIRHATRPRATISVFASVSGLPFDVHPIRALPYSLDESGRLTDRTREHLVEELTSRLRAALEETASDSPLFQLIHDYPGVTLPHDVTETFQRRASALAALSDRIRTAAERHACEDEARVELRGIQAELATNPSLPTELHVDLLLAYRDVKAYEEMLLLVEQLPREIRGAGAIRQLEAFALNRRNGPGDRARAARQLQQLIRDNGPSPETYGLLGRVHKDRYFDALSAGRTERAVAALDDAVDAYVKGFECDVRDYYPGVNAVTLLLVRGSPEARARLEALSPVVHFAVSSRRGLASRDYWDVATVLELAAVRADASLSADAMRRLSALDPRPWMRETTVRNLTLVRDAHMRDGREVTWLDGIIERLQRWDDEY